MTIDLFQNVEMSHHALDVEQLHYLSVKIEQAKLRATFQELDEQDYVSLIEV